MKRFLSFLLSTAILVTSVPANVFAGGSDLNTKNSQITYTIASESDASEKKDVERPENETEGKEFNISEDVYPVNPYSDKFPEDGSYYIRNEYSMKFVAYEKEDGSVFETEYDTDEKQTWEFKRQDDESYTIEVSGGDKLYLSLKYSEKATNSDFTYSLEPVIKATDKISDSEKWFLIEEAGEGTRLVSGAVFTKEDLDKLKEGKSFKDIGKDIFALSLSKNNSNKGESYYNVGSSAENTLHITKINEDKNDEERYKQLFAITPTFLQKTDVSTLGFEEGKSYYIENTVSKKVMSLDLSNRLIQDENYRLDNQKWVVHRNSEGYYTFSLKQKPGYYIVSSRFKEFALSIEKESGQIKDEMQWSIVNTGNGFALKPKWADKDIYACVGYASDKKEDKELEEYSFKSRSILHCLPVTEKSINNFTWEFKEVQDDTPDIDENKTYYIKNAYSGKVLSVMAESEVLIQEENINISYQKWKFNKDKDGYYTISSINKPYEALCLNPKHPWVVKNREAVMELSKKGLHKDEEFKKWRITKTGTGRILISAKKSEGSLVLDCGYFNNFEVDDKLKEYASAERSVIHQLEKHEAGFGSDEWVLEEAKEEKPVLEPGKVYRIKNVYSEKVLSYDEAGKLMQRKDMNLSSQRWKVNDEGEGYISLSPEGLDGKFISIGTPNPRTYKNTDTQISDKKDNKALWKIQTLNTGNIIISSKECDEEMVLSCTDGEIKDKNEVVKYAKKDFSKIRLAEIEKTDLATYEWQFEEYIEDKPDIENGKTYYITNAYSKKVLSIDSDGRTRQSENNGLERQKWIIHDEGGGYYSFQLAGDPDKKLREFTSAYSRDAYLCIGKVDKNTDTGKFKIKKTNSGNLYISLKASDNSLFLTSGYYNEGRADEKLKEYAGKEGSYVNQALLSDNGLKNDEWYLESVEDNKAMPDEGMVYELKNAYSKLYATVGTQGDNSVTQEKKDTGKIQQWVFKKQDDGTYTISPKTDQETCIGVMHASNFKHLPVQLMKKDEKSLSSIKWKLTKSKQGYLRIASKNSNYNQFLTAGYANEGEVDEKLKEYAKTEGIRLGHIFDNNKEFLNDEWMLIPVEDGAGNAYHKVEFKIYGHTVYTEYVKHGGAAKGPSFAFLHKLGFIHEDELKKNASLNASLYTNENENTDLYTNEDGLAGLYKSEEFSEGEEFSLEEYGYYEPYEDYSFMTGEATALEEKESEEVSISKEGNQGIKDEYIDNNEISGKDYVDVKEYGEFADEKVFENILKWDKPFSKITAAVVVNAVVMSKIPNTKTTILEIDKWTTLGTKKNKDKVAYRAKLPEKVTNTNEDNKETYMLVIAANSRAEGSVLLKKTVIIWEETQTKYEYSTQQNYYSISLEKGSYVLENGGDEDVVLKICKEYKNIKVNFYDNDKKIKEVTKPKNSHMEEKDMPEEPFKSGYTFKGWSYKGKIVGDFSELLTGEYEVIDLQAEYEKDKDKEDKDKEDEFILTDKNLKDIRWDIKKSGLHADDFNKKFKEYGVTDRLSIIMFLATILHESGNGMYTIEAANKYPTKESWKKYNPGYEFEERGAGYIQLTGADIQDEFVEYMKEKGVIKGENEDRVKFIANHPLDASLWYWTNTKAKNTRVGSIDSYIKEYGRNRMKGVEGKHREAVYVIIQYFVNKGVDPDGELSKKLREISESYGKIDYQIEKFREDKSNYDYIKISGKYEKAPQHMKERMNIYYNVLGFLGGKELNYDK